MSKKFVLLNIFAAFLFWAKNVSSDDIYCDNNCLQRHGTQETELSGGYYCVLTDPTKFTTCLFGLRLMGSCPPGLVMDPAANTCNWPALSKPCSQYCQPGKNTVFYYTNWSQYRAGSASFKPENIDPTLCTHIIYAFLKFDATSISLSEWNDDVMIAKILQLKQQNPELKVLAAIGGFGAGSAMFQQIIATPTSRIAFNQGAISFLRQYHFDGLDVDFEYPSSTDKRNFAMWIQSLSRAFKTEATKSGEERLLLTAAIAAGKYFIDTGYDIVGIVNSLDFMSVMTYDFHGTWESVTGLNSPLYSLPSWPPGSALAVFTSSYVVDYLISLGARPSKLILGIPFYGHSFTLADPSKTGIGAPATGAGLAGAYTGASGTIAYYESCMLSKCKATPYTYIYDNTIQCPYMFSGTNWISTEDINSVAAKVEFAMEKRLGGVMFWSLDFDDFNDLCQHGVQFPLLKTAYNTLRGVSSPTLNSGGLDSIMCSAVVSE